MTELVYIYILSDSKGNIRYIGKTDNLKRRLKEHLYESKTNPKNHRHYWILSLLRKNEKPIIEILDAIPAAEWEFWEKHYISLFKSWGFDLVNETNGGETGLGMLGKFHKEESKERIRRANSGTNHYNYGGTLSKEHKNSLSKSLSGVKNSFFGKHHSEDILLKMRKPILQYGLDGIFIKEWNSIKEAEDVLKIHTISYACNKKLNSIGGFVWTFKYDDNYPKQIVIAKKYRKPVLQLAFNGEIIKEWPSIRAAEKQLGISHISKVCNEIESFKTAGGFIWKFKK